MSHFTVLVIGNDYEKQLQPYHEYECTGIDDEYVVDVDVTDKVNEDLNREVFVDSLENPTDYHYFEKEGFTFKMVRREYLEKKGESIAAWAKDWSGAEYREDGRYYDHTNPNAKWDWYQVGGRWAGFFKLKEGAKGTQGTQSWMQKMNGTEYPKGNADQAYKGDIDFESIREEARLKAAEEYDRLLAILNETNLPTLKYTWKEVFESERFSNLDNDEKRAIYHAQNILVKIKNLSRSEKLSKEDQSFLCWLDYEKYLCTREEFIAKAGRSAISTFAVVLDGKWYEKGEMGWWGVVSDEKEQDKWDEEFERLLNNTSDETLLTVVDCHI